MKNYMTEADRDGSIVALIGVETIGEENMIEVLDMISEFVREKDPAAEFYIADMKASNGEGDLESFSVMDSPYSGV